MKRKAKPAGATAAELAHGIGFTVTSPLAGWREDPMASRHTEARRGAAAMRREAFLHRVFGPDWTSCQMHPGAIQAIGQTPVKPGDRDYVAAWWEEREQGCPAWKEDAA